MDETQIKFDSNVYIRKLKSQELGYRAGKPRGAGRYFFVSKSAISYFPPLSEVAKNDHVLLDVIPDNSDEVVLTNYVYHNDSLSTEDGTRDEYRLYLNINIDHERNYFNPDDIVLIVKCYDGENLFYKLIRIQPSSHDYVKLNAIVESIDTAYKSHAMVALASLTFVDCLRKIKLGKKIIPEEIIKEALAEPVFHVPVAEDDTTRVIRSKSFRDLVLYFYDYRCAITGKELFIDHKDFNNLEAAHLLARASGGGGNPANGMALERNLHWAFDKGFFTVNFDGSDYIVEVHKEAMRIPYLASKHRKKMIVPEDSRSRPNIESLKWHRENVFGMFLK